MITVVTFHHLDELPEDGIVVFRLPEKIRTDVNAHIHSSLLCVCDNINEFAFAKGYTTFGRMINAFRGFCRFFDCIDGRSVGKKKSIAEQDQIAREKYQG